MSAEGILYGPGIDIYIFFATLINSYVYCIISGFEEQSANRSHIIFALIFIFKAVYTSKNSDHELNI